MIINYDNGKKFAEKTRRQNGFPKANISNHVQKIIISIIIKGNFSLMMSFLIIQM